MNYVHAAESYVMHYVSQIHLPWLVVLLLLGLLFFVSMVGMGFDKYWAQRGEWRLSEKFLLELAFLGGVWGILAGAFLFHHKTEKMVFMAFVWGAAGLWAYVLFVVMPHFFGPPFPWLVHTGSPNSGT